MPGEDQGLEIRPARPEDEPAILDLVPRLASFGPPSWRDAEAMTATDRRIIRDALRSPGDEPLVLVASDAQGRIAGFVHLTSLVDYYREKKHGHVADLVIAPSFEGQGVARLLLAAAEDWARGHGYDWLTLSVFEDNVRAVRLYQQAGFGRDMIRLLKPI